MSSVKHASVSLTHWAGAIEGHFLGPYLSEDQLLSTRLLGDLPMAPWPFRDSVVPEGREEAQLGVPGNSQAFCSVVKMVSRRLLF